MTKRRSKDMKGDARDLVWWWDQPPSINDESWAQLLALANPKLSPDCAAAKDARRRAELGVQLLLRQKSYNYEREAQDGYSFLETLDAATFSVQIASRERELNLGFLKKTA